MPLFFTVPVFSVKSTRYTIVETPTVHATSAENLCYLATGGTLARITDQNIQNEVWRQATDRGISADYWIAGRRTQLTGVTANGVYWLRSSKSASISRVTRSNILLIEVNGLNI